MTELGWLPALTPTGRSSFYHVVMITLLRMHYCAYCSNVFYCPIGMLPWLQSLTVNWDQYWSRCLCNKGHWAGTLSYKLRWSILRTRYLCNKGYRVGGHFNGPGTYATRGTGRVVHMVQLRLHLWPMTAGPSLLSRALYIPTPCFQQ